MVRIELETLIDAPVSRVFDLARSIDAHLASAEGTGERAIGGRTAGLIERGETVTWEARHFGLRQRMTVRITAMDRPRMFEDEMTEGPFMFLRHRHEFEARGATTAMKDLLEFAAPLGFLGRSVERLVLGSHMERFLVERNRVLRRIAEGGEWRRYLEPSVGPGDRSGP